MRIVPHRWWTKQVSLRRTLKWCILPFTLALWARGGAGEGHIDVPSDEMGFGAAVFICFVPRVQQQGMFMYMIITCVCSCLVGQLLWLQRIVWVASSVKPLKWRTWRSWLCCWLLSSRNLTGAGGCLRPRNSMCLNAVATLILDLDMQTLAVPTGASGYLAHLGATPQGVEDVMAFIQPTTSQWPCLRLHCRTDARPDVNGSRGRHGQMHQTAVNVRSQSSWIPSSSLCRHVMEARWAWRWPPVRLAQTQVRKWRHLPHNRTGANGCHWAPSSMLSSATAPWDLPANPKKAVQIGADGFRLPPGSTLPSAAFAVDRDQSWQVETLDAWTGASGCQHHLGKTPLTVLSAVYNPPL